MSAPRALFTLPWEGPLYEGALVRRYHRFLADVALREGPDAGATVVAHCVNSGRMEGMVRKGARVWVSPAANPKRALKYTWELIELEGRLVGASTLLPNKLVGAMLAARALPGFERHEGFAAERAYGHGSRVDFEVFESGASHLIEVKNCHLVYEDGGGYFPDSVSERGSKHLRELARVARAGGRATVLFTVQRSDVRFVRPSAVHDEVFARAARAAGRAGVGFRALRIEPTVREGLRVLDEVPVDLAPYALPPVRAFSASLAAYTGWERPPKAKKAEVAASEPAAARARAAPKRGAAVATKKQR